MKREQKFLAAFSVVVLCAGLFVGCKDLFHPDGADEQLDPPSSVTASAASSNSITVSWSSVSDASSYKVYRATSGGGTYSFIANAYSTSYTDTGLSSNTTYYYKVSAYNSASGIESDKSSYGSASTSLSPPSSVSASAASSSSVTVSWSSVSSASYYKVYRATSGGGTYSFIANAYSTSYTDTGLSSNTTYYYKVSVYSGASGRESGMSSSYDYATTSSSYSLSAPSSVSASAASSSSITVSWSSVSNASYYKVYRATSGYGTYEYIANAYSTSYTDTGLSSGTTYYYKVSAYSGSYGESGMSSYDYATTSSSLSAPSSVSASAASSSSITVSWSSVSNASYYNIYRATSDYGSYEYIANAYSTSYTDTGLYSGTTYYYKVSAYSGSYGESGMSSYDYATTSSSLSPPSSVSASAASSSSITVSWSSVSSASYYNIYRATSGYGSYEYIGYTYSTSYTDTGLSSGTTYYYKVSTYSGSYGESGMSSYDYATTSLSYSLSAPSSVSASAASSSSITVSWSSVSSASYYNVYRATSGYGTYEYIGYTYSTSYTDTGLSSGTSYYYKVSAYSGSYGESSLSSYDYAATSSSYTDISYNTWYTYSLPLGESQDYRIYVSSGYTYTITWEDSDSGYSSCDIVVSASWQDSGSTIFNRADTELQKSFYASSSGYVIVTVQGYSSAQYGNYRIRYYY